MFFSQVRQLVENDESDDGINDQGENQSDSDDSESQYDESPESDKSFISLIQRICKFNLVWTMC